MLDRFGEKIISPLDRLSPFSADDKLMSAFQVLGAICEKALGCGFIATIRNDRGDFCRIDSRLDSKSDVEFVMLDLTAQCAAQRECDPKPA